MRTLVLVAAFAVAATVPTFANHRSDIGIAGDAAEIRRIISDKECVSGAEVLRFGESIPGSPGTFERTGRAPATYQIGYATLLVYRDGQLHSHVIVVSPETRTLHLGGVAYHCSG
jgi:hypothetical protein